MFQFEQKEQYTLEEVQQLVEGFKAKVEETIATKDTTIAELTTKVEGVEELTKSNHDLTIKNALIQNGLSDDVFDLIYDEDLEKVQSKIAKIKELSKQQEIDNSYKPTDKRTEDAYEKAIKSNDVEGALKQKLSRLFG